MPVAGREHRGEVGGASVYELLEHKRERWSARVPKKGAAKLAVARRNLAGRA